MSRTFSLDKPLFNSDAHESATRIERAMKEGNVVNADGQLVTSFNFDLLECVKGIQVKRLKDEALSRLSYSADAYISGALSRMLNEFYQHSKSESAVLSFATYTDFLRHIEGIEATEQSLYETGCDVRPSIDNIRHLLAFRTHVHDLIGNDKDCTRSRKDRVIDGIYQMPDIREFLASPQMRSLSVAAELGLADIVADDAGDDKALAEELMAQYKLDSQLERMQQHRMDVMKAKSLVMLFSCLKVDGNEIAADDEDPFADLEPRVQFGLMNGTMRAITEARRKAVTDSRIPVLEKAALRVEAKALMSTLTTALSHSLFADLA